MTSVVTYYTGISSVAVIGNYLPRQCGIATFAVDTLLNNTRVIRS